MRSKLLIGIALLICILTGLPSLAQETSPSAPPQEQEEDVGRTPPRLSFVDGQVSFWRPGAQDWVQAQLNTAIAPGDQLYTGSPGNLEMQIGPRSRVRGWADTQIGLESLEPDFIQFKVTAGHASFDLRTLDPGIRWRWTLRTRRSPSSMRAITAWTSSANAPRSSPAGRDAPP